MVDHLPRLQFAYPITKAYPWPHFTLVAMVLGALVVSIMTVINVVAVGYETITTFSQDFNVTERYWWSRFSRSRTYASNCQAYEFLLGDSFSTNMTIFEYTIILLEDGNAPMKKPVYGMTYSGNTLASICDVATIQVKPSVFVSRQQKMVEGEIDFWCQGDGFPESAFELTYTTNMLPIPTGAILTDSDASVLLQEALDLLAYDLIVGIIAASANSSSAIDSFLASGNVSFQAVETGTATTTDTHAQQYELMMSLYDFQAIFSNDSILDYNMGQLNLPDILNRSANNYLQALSAAFLADIGIWNVNNMFTSQNVLNATIDRNDPVSSALAQDPALYLWQNPLEPGAQVLRSGLLSSTPDSPIIPPSNQSSAVIALSYLCQVQQMKDLLDLIISVIVADASMFGAFWGFFMLGATMLAHSRGDKANYCDAHAND